MILCRGSLTISEGKEPADSGGGGKSNTLLKENAPSCVRFNHIFPKRGKAGDAGGAAVAVAGQIIHVTCRIPLS